MLLLVGSTVAMSNVSALPAVWRDMLTEALPILAMALGLLLSIKFNRSRYTFLLLFLGTGFAATVYFRDSLGQLLYPVLFAGLLLNSFLFSLLKDRGLLSVHGALRLAFLLAQVVVISFLLESSGDRITSLLSHNLLTLPASLQPVLNLPDSLVLLGLLLASLHLLLALIFNHSLHATFFGCQLGLLGFAGSYEGESLVAMLTLGCALMVILSIIFDSHNMAYRDELTGLPSRRALNQSLLSLGRRYTVAMLDIDHFKKFNDTHGHDIGDEVLKMVASRIARVSGGGKPFRYGGEEFTVLFPGKDPEQAEAHLEVLRKTIENYKMVVRAAPRKNGSRDKKAKSQRGKKASRNKSLSVTISIGFAKRDEQAREPEHVIKAADQALYRAKKKGRNCVSA